MRYALALLALLVVSAPAQRLALFDFQVVEVESTTLRTTMLMLSDRLTDAGFVIVAPAPGTVVTTADQAVAEAVELQVDKAVFGSVTRLGSRFIISYKLVDAPARQVEFSDRASIGTVEELDVATERIAAAIRDKKPFAATGEVGKVTAAERAGSSALSAAFLTTGYSFPLVRPFGNSPDPGSMLFTLAGALSYETPQLLVTGELGLRRGKNDFNEVFFDLLVHKLFSTSDVSPYIGGGLGVRRMSFYSGEDDGLALIVSGGLMLFRTQYFRVIGGARYSLTLAEDYGMVPMLGFNFGLTSPTIGPGAPVGGMDIPSPCIYGCLGLFFLTGLAVALTT